VLVCLNDCFVQWLCFLLQLKYIIDVESLLQEITISLLYLSDPDKQNGKRVYIKEIYFSLLTTPDMIQWIFGYYSYVRSVPVYMLVYFPLRVEEISFTSFDFPL
jgi:hypothetical protein